MIEEAERGEYDRCAEALARDGFYVQSDFLEPSLVTALRNETLERFEAGELEKARVGSGTERQLAPSIRRDWIGWLDPNALTEAQREVATKLEGLRVAINRTTYLGLWEWEGHLAIYPPGSFYARHVDVFRAHRERQVTFILYLNPEWVEGCGGELRVYGRGSADAGEATYVDVAPRGGTLVLFFSEELHHEVLLSHSERASLTGWFRTRSE